MPIGLDFFSVYVNLGGMKKWKRCYNGNQLHLRNVFAFCCKLFEKVAVWLNAHQAPQTVSRFATKHPPAYRGNLCFGYRTDKN